jgi:hypothetical protein
MWHAEIKSNLAAAITIKQHKPNLNQNRTAMDWAQRRLNACTQSWAHKVRLRPQPTEKIIRPRPPCSQELRRWAVTAMQPRPFKLCQQEKHKQEKSCQPRNTAMQPIAQQMGGDRHAAMAVPIA